MPCNYLFEKQIFEGQEPGHDDILTRVITRYNSLRIQSRECASVVKGEAVKKDPDKICCFTFRKIGHMSRACPRRKSDQKSNSNWIKDSSSNLSDEKAGNAIDIAPAPDDMESLGTLILARSAPSAAKHGRGRIDHGKDGPSQGADVH